VARKGDIEGLPGRTQAATKGVTALSGAFGELSKKGELSASSINQIAGSLAMVNPLLGLVAASVGAVVSSFKLLEELELKDSMALFAVGARQTVAEFERFAAVTQAGAEASAGLKTKAEELAVAQSILREKTASVASEAARQNKLVADGTTTQESADAALAAFTQGVINNYTATVQRVAGLKDDIAAIQQQTAVTKRQQQAQEAYNASVTRENALYSARREGRARFDIFASQSRAEELQQLEMIAGQYERQYDLEVANGDVNAAVTLQNLRNSQDRIDALESEIEMQHRVGAIAQSAIAGTASGAFDAYAEALDKTVSLNALFEKSTDRTLRNVAASTIRNVGRQAAVEGAMEAARALASLAVRDFEGAGNHAAASAAFFGVAAAAGVAAGLVSVKPASASSGGRGRGDAGAGDGKSGPVIHLTVIGNLDTEARKDLGRQLREEFYEGG